MFARTSADAERGRRGDLVRCSRDGIAWPSVHEITTALIKAEVISFQDLVDTGSVVEARSKARPTWRARNVMQDDGDVAFRFNA
ncbi:hypothetical protein CQ044_11455 [Microbacterium sp. MYb64]|nr:hypothetical protein CQ044_11455 [Microbacterium sp. MYb64]